MCVCVCVCVCFLLAPSFKSCEITAALRLYSLFALLLTVFLHTGHVCHIVFIGDNGLTHPGKHTGSGEEADSDQRKRERERERER